MLEVSNLSVSFYSEGKETRAVDDLSFAVGAGEIFGLVGESGAGKSTVALSIMRLIPAAGEIIFQGRDLFKLPEPEMIKIRGAEISMIFQDPFTSLNPVLTVGDQIAEALRLHQGLDNKSAWQKAVEMMEMVHINDPQLRIKDYPHQFSGGMRQRVMIAMALACRPKLLIADEPTTALDVTIQSDILKLILEMREKFNLAVIYITHNFKIVKEICDRVIVMQGGRAVEGGTVESVFNAPRQDYTKRLIKCLSELKI